MRHRKNWIRLAMLALALAPAAAAQDGTLHVKVKPKKTGVFVDGKFMGTAGKYSVAAGEHQVWLSEGASSEHTTKVTVEAGKTAVLDHRMSALPLANPPFGSLTIAGGSDESAVLVNGRYMGQAREFRGKSFQLPPGQYLVEIMARGGSNVSTKEKISITTKQVTTVNAR